MVASITRTARVILINKLGQKRPFEEVLNVDFQTLDFC